MRGFIFCLYAAFFLCLFRVAFAQVVDFILSDAVVDLVAPCVSVVAFPTIVLRSRLADLRILSCPPICVLCRSSCPRSLDGIHFGLSGLTTLGVSDAALPPLVVVAYVAGVSRAVK